MEEEEEEGCSSELWLMSYADLMTLLFAAFVVLYGITPQGKAEEVLGAVSSIREAFVEIPDEIPPDVQRKGPIVMGKAAFKYFKGEMARPPIIKRYKRSVKVLNIINADMEEAKNVLVLKNKTGRATRVARNRDGADVSVHQDADGFRLRLVASSFYKPGAYRVDRRQVQRLSYIVKFLKTLDRPITIEGHTDNSEPSGNLGNLELSSLRAAHMAQFFVKVLGFPKNKISVAGFGDMKPIASNDTPEGRKSNRRIEIKIHYDD